MLQTITKLFPLRISDFAAALSGVNGFTGRGVIAFSAWSCGARDMSVELRGVAGQKADVYVNEQHVVSLKFDNGRANTIFDTRSGDSLPYLNEGGRVEIRQNGDVILTGVLNPN